MRALNEEFLAGNTCFGCGPANPDGLQIRIFRDGTSTDRLVGTFQPRALSAGFPEILHGGLQFTALDCMAGWVVLILRSTGKVMPLTRSAVMRYLRPALIGRELALSAQVVRDPTGPREPILIRAEARQAGKLVSEADFEYVSLPAEKFKRLVGVGELPDCYRRHFGEI